MKELLLIALGGASGALCRYGLVNFVKFGSNGHFPYGTLIVNLIGSFFIGVMYVLITERLALHPDWRHILVVGFLGAFTTFSTFSLEAVTLLESGHIATAAVYVLSSLFICIFAAWVAIVITRLI